MVMVSIHWACGCRAYYVLPFDDYTDAESYVLDNWQPLCNCSVLFSDVEDIWDESVAFC